MLEASGLQGALLLLQNLTSGLDNKTGSSCQATYDIPPNLLEFPTVLPPPIRLSEESLAPANIATDNHVHYLMPRKEVIVQGDTQIGTIECIGHTHTLYYEFEDTLRKIGICQEQVLLHLQKSAAEIIFVEGLWKDFPAFNTPTGSLSTYCYELLSPCYRKYHQLEQFGNFLRNIFQNFQPGTEFDDQQKLYLGLIGAPFIYALCNPAVSLMKAIPQEIDAKIPALQQATKNSPQLQNFIINDYREYLAMKEAKQYLDQYPGSKLYLVYGTAHPFQKAAMSAFKDPPVVIKANWNNLEGQLGWRIAA